MSIAWATVAIEDEFLKKHNEVIAALNLSGTDIKNFDEPRLTMVSKRVYQYCTALNGSL
jgi:hypothetical protein